MQTIEIIPAQKLSAIDRRLWSEWQATNPDLASPYFHPEFTQAVARVRDDVLIAVVRKGNATAALLPFQRGKLNFGRPVGGKLSDYHGLIAPGDVCVDAQRLLRACGLAGWDFDHLLASQTAFVASHQTVRPSRIIDLSQGFDAYCAERRAAGTEAIKKTQHKARKLEREVGPLRFTTHTEAEAVFEQLRAWKSDQYRRTGLTDIFEFPWTANLLRDLLQKSDAEFAGEMSALWCGDRLAAAMISLRSRQVLHAWFPAYDPELAAYSPGMILFLKLAEEGPTRGITQMDLGTGDERYKLQITTPGPLLAQGSLEGGGPAVWLRKGWRTTRSLLESPQRTVAGKSPLQFLQPLRSWLAFR